MVLLSSDTVHFCDPHLTFICPLTNSHVYPVKARERTERKRMKEKQLKNVQIKWFIFNKTYDRTIARSEYMLLMAGIKSNFTNHGRFQHTIIVLS